MNFGARHLNSFNQSFIDRADFIHRCVMGEADAKPLSNEDILAHKEELFDQLRFTLDEYEEENLAILEKALNPKHPLGKIFHQPRGAKFWGNTNTVNKLRIEQFKLLLPLWLEEGPSSHDQKAAYAAARAAQNAYAIAHKECFYEALCGIADTTEGAELIRAAKNPATGLGAIFATHRGIFKFGETRTRKAVKKLTAPTRFTAVPHRAEMKLKL